MSVAGSTNPTNVLRPRIGAARLLLSSQSDPQKKAEASATQAASVIETIKSTVLSAEDRATVQCLLATVDWCPHDLLEMSAHVSVPPTSASEKAAAPTMGRQWTMQNYSSVVYALTQHEWDQLLATMVTLSCPRRWMSWLGALSTLGAEGLANRHSKHGLRARSWCLRLLNISTRCRPFRRNGTNPN